MLTLEDVMPLHLTDWTAPDSHPLRGTRGQVFAYAVSHPAGLILFETGFGRDNPRIDELYQAVHRPIQAELERIGRQMSEVRAIVNSHLHFDHCGNNALFPGVAIYVQADEYLAAHEPGYTVPGWIDFPDADYHQIEGDREIALGVKIVSTPGHTPGHQSLVVESNSGPIILVGQAMYSRAEYEQIRDAAELSPDDAQQDPISYLASARRLMGLGARRVFFSHDAASYEPAD